MTRYRPRIFLTAAAVCALAARTAFPLRTQTDNPVVTGPRGVHPYVLDGMGKRAALAPEPGDPNWSLLAHSRRQEEPQTLRIVAFMVEFNGGEPDSTDATTGTGLFNIWKLGTGTANDVEEAGYYDFDDGEYAYDNLDHYQDYFARQLDYATTYYDRVSNGRLRLEYDIFPRELGTAYHVDEPMTAYSPGGKYPKETWDEYYLRRTRALMQFVVDAVKAAGTQQGGDGNPFDIVASVDAEGTPRDSAGNPVGFMVIHAGASYLTDGGESGAYGADSPSDMIDAFISPDFFSYFRDDLAFDSTGGDFGVRVQSGAGELLVNEVMMLCETSNQDGLNWGIHGILINQIARQIGLPDLFSTSSGISGIGAFCIMDFAGYSAAKGFAPPWPSAWVRAFMGWDEPKVAPIGRSGSYRVKAVGMDGLDTQDTTILLVPINDHEYFLIENRQRNPGGRSGVFEYDTTDDGVRHLASYPYNTNIGAVVTDSSGRDSANAILDVYHYDIGLPASGVLVWHIDEEVIRRRMASNLLNADSLYRGISLVEADGIDDLGIMFEDAFYQAAFDWGGAEDVFPHTRVSGRTVDSLGPYTRPSTRSNDGGQTYLTMHIRGCTDGAPSEKYAIRDYFVRNTADTAFSVTLDWSYLVAGWPHRIAPDSIFEPLPADISTHTDGKELLVLSRGGHLYVLPPAIDSAALYNRLPMTIPVVDLNGDTLVDTTGNRVLDTAFYAARIDKPVGMPSLIDNEVFVPLAAGDVAVLTAVDAGGGLLWDTVSLGVTPATHVCGYETENWAIGCEGGVVVFGAGRAVTATVRLADSADVSWVAALPGSAGDVACVQRNGIVSVCAADDAGTPDTVRLEQGIGPYSLVTGDLDRNDSGRAEIVVCDSRQGVWVLNDDLTLAVGWTPEPNDWANAYALSEEQDYDERRLLPFNPSPPTLADLNGDGQLDILCGGTNGVYALNYKGVLIKGWPYYLDNRYWLQRGSVTAAPVTGADGDGKPLVLFASPTGDNPTFGIVKITGVNDNHTKVYYRRDDGAVDSIWDLEASLVDSILRYNDSLIAPYILPGGYVDAIDAGAQRPYRRIASLPNVGRETLYDWPLTTGATIGTSPLLGDLDGDDNTDLIAVSRAGWVYRWEPEATVLSLTGNEWRMAGYEPSRTFAYTGAAPANTGGADTIGFYSFPNPTDGVDEVVFRYAFTGEATNVRIDVFTYTGHLVYSWREPDAQALVNYPDWNEHVMSLRKLGPAVYRCRLGATIDGKECSRFWKMAVVK